jgi:hypothetical protein
MRALAVIVVAASLVACTTDVFGPYAQSISQQDIEEIKAVMAIRPDIHKFILRISATRPNCVYVETAPTVLDQTSTSFTACKRNGRWHIRERHVEKWRTIVTE